MINVIINMFTKMKLILAIYFTLLISAELLQLVYGQEGFPIVTIDGSAGQTGTCPAKEKLEMSLQLIRSDIIDILRPSLIPECGDGRWYRVAHINMSDPTQQCPSAWREYSTNGVRACGRPVTTGESCPATTYSTNHQYNKVCGRVIGYQFGSPDAFRSFDNTLDQNYMDGVSITHGTPRHHIWSYVAGVTENSLQHTVNNCPCSSQSNNQPQAFIGENYYCESGNPEDDFASQLYPGDKLWDGQQCEDSCCTGKSPPWFILQLPAPTNDVIEVRICDDESTDNEDNPVELIELYVNI